MTSNSIFDPDRDRKPSPDTASLKALKVQGYVLIVLVCVGLSFAAWVVFGPLSKYEYKVIDFLAESNDRTGQAALKYASVKIEETQLQKMGAEGWELVDVFLEMETAFPNFGSSEYVTGLQPNVRPQRAVLLFKAASSVTSLKRTHTRRKLDA